LQWADAYFWRNRDWPHGDSEPIPESPGDTWKKIDAALRDGRRTLPGGSSLRQLLARRRGVRNKGNLPPLPIAPVLAWAAAVQRRTGAWPTHRSGPIRESPGDTWQTVDTALRQGLRGLPGGSSLARLRDGVDRAGGSRGRRP